jgi:hypothetical protein
MNVQPQFTGYTSRPQQKLATQLFNRSHKRQRIQDSLLANTMHSGQSSSLPTQLAKARLHFTVAEDQALVLRRLLVSTADLHLQELQMTPITSKQIVKIALVLEPKAVDRVIHAVIKNMQSAEIGSIIMV